MCLFSRRVDGASKDIFSCSGAGDVAAVDAFLAAGALVNDQDSSGRTCVLVMHPSCHRVTIQSAEFLPWIPSSNARLNRALHWAVDREQQSLALHLLAHHKANPNVQDDEGQTCLHYATMCEHVELVRLLLTHGADASVADKAGEVPVDSVRGSNPELLACFSNLNINSGSK